MKSIHRNFGFALCAMPLVLMACGKDDNDTTDNGAKVRETPADLRGAWLSPCMTSAMPGLQRVQREYIFNAIGDFDKVERYYSDDNCQTIGSTFKTIGTVDARGTLTEDKSVQSINLTANDAFFTVNSDAAVSSFNALKLCGQADWVVNKEKSVINTSCAGAQVKQGDVIFDVYSKRGDALYFGKTSLFLVPDSGDNRPTTVDTAAPYSKK